MARGNHLACPVVHGSNGKRVGAVDWVVDGNWLSDKTVCEHQLTIGQAVKDVFLLIQTLGYDFLEIQGMKIFYISLLSRQSLY